MEQERLIIGIAGGSGSGKTTLTDRLARCFDGEVTVVSHDDYYRARDDLSMEERRHINYDHPNAFETELLVEHLRRLRRGEMNSAIQYMQNLGLDGFCQERTSAKEEYTPPFDLTGV